MQCLRGTTNSLAALLKPGAETVPAACRSALIIAAILCGAMLAGVVTAEASAAKRAKFRVTVTGTDRASWSYRFADRCRGGGDLVGVGSEVVSYRTARQVAISARPPVGGDPEIDPTAKLPILGPGPNRGARFLVNATITRRSTLACPDGETVSGEDEPQGSPDCGTKRFTILGNLRFLTDGRGLGFFSMAASRRRPFRHCYSYNALARGSVGIGTRDSGARLSTKTLFNPRKRRFTLSARSLWRSPTRGATFTTTWKATFRRIR